MFTDSMGRHSKRLPLQGAGQHAVVRKMACHNGLAYGKDKAKDRGAKKPGGQQAGKKEAKKSRKRPPLSVQQGKVAKKQKKDEQRSKVKQQL